MDQFFKSLETNNQSTIGSEADDESNGNFFSDILKAEEDKKITYTIPPPPPGGYLEPHYHFYTTSDPDHAFASILVNLQDINGTHTKVITTSIEKERFKMTFQVEEGAMVVPFVVRIFSSLDAIQYPNQYVVEFQRRTGDTLLFIGMYQYIYDQLEKILEITSPRKFKSYSSTSVFNPKTDRFSTYNQQPYVPLRTLSTTQTDSEGAVQTVKCLLQMVKSEYADVKSQGITTLTNLCSKNEIIKAEFIRLGGQALVPSIL
jgi:hypothetical protein